MTKEQLSSLINKDINNLENLIDYTLSANEKFNLTAIKDKDLFRELMIYDSLIPSKYINFDDKSILDIGTGAGFPGLPLALTTKGNFTLLDSTKKKVDHINNFIKENNISNAIAINDRAEEFAQKHREEFDFVIARAVAPLPILLELCLPMVKVSGYFLAMKSNKSDDEIKMSLKALKLLGGTIESTTLDELPCSKESRILIKIKKVENTNRKYPRRFDQIKSKPL